MLDFGPREMRKNPKISNCSFHFSNKAIYDKHVKFSKKHRFRILSECTSVDYIDQEWHNQGP
jgi:hypothetical protein